MDHERLVRLAGGGGVRAFVELAKATPALRRFGSALALIHDFQLAEDVVQESFLAAWSALPSLADPAAFSGWLRGIVRHHAFRVLRRRRPETLPLSDADQVPNEEAARTNSLGIGNRPRPPLRRSLLCRLRCANRQRSSLCTRARTRTSPRS